MIGRVINYCRLLKKVIYKAVISITGFKILKMLATEMFKELGIVVETSNNNVLSDDRVNMND